MDKSNHELENNETFPGGSDGKESACNAGDRVQSLGQEDPLEKEMATHSSGELETPIWCLDMSLSKLRKMMKDKEAWMLLSMGISKSLT